MKKETRGGSRPGSGRKAKSDKLDVTVTFRIKETWREPIKKVVRAAIKKLNTR